MQKHKHTPLITTNKNKKSYSYFKIFFEIKKSEDDAKTQIIKKTNNSWKFWLKKYNLSFWKKSKQKKTNNKVKKKLEMEVKGLSNTGCDSILQEEKCAVKQIFAKR